MCPLEEESHSYEEYTDNCLIPKIVGLKNALHLHEELGNNLTTTQKEFVDEYNPKGFAYMRQRPVVDAPLPGIPKNSKRVTFDQEYTLYSNMCIDNTPRDPREEIENIPDITINSLFLTRANCFSGKEANLLTKNQL